MPPLLWILLFSLRSLYSHSTWQKSTRIDVLITFTVRFPLISPNFTSLCSFEQWPNRRSKKYIINHIMKRKEKKSRQIRWALLFFPIYFFFLRRSYSLICSRHFTLKEIWLTSPKNWVVFMLDEPKIRVSNTKNLTKHKFWMEHVALFRSLLSHFDQISKTK